jgi:hypothetical protein
VPPTRSVAEAARRDYDEPAGARASGLSREVKQPHAAMPGAWWTGCSSDVTGFTPVTGPHWNYVTVRR